MIVYKSLAGFHPRITHSLSMNPLIPLRCILTLAGLIDCADWGVLEHPFFGNRRRPTVINMAMMPYSKF